MDGSIAEVRDAGGATGGVSLEKSSKMKTNVLQMKIHLSSADTGLCLVQTTTDSIIKN